MYDLVDGHAVTEHAGDESGIVPELTVELITESLDGGLETAGVDELEVLALRAV